MASNRLNFNVALAGECMAARPFSMHDDKASMEVIDLLRAGRGCRPRPADPSAR